MRDKKDKKFRHNLEHHSRPAKDRNPGSVNRKAAPSRQKSSDETPSAALMVGRRALVEAARHRADAVKDVWLQRGAELSGELVGALKQLENNGTKIHRCSAEEFETALAPLSLQSEEVRHQGVIARVIPQPLLSLNELLERCGLPSGVAVDSDSRMMLLIADQLTDPQNLGALLRIADGVGVSGCILTADRSAEVSPVVRKVSAGASETVPCAVVPNLARAIDDLKKRGFWVIGTSCEPGSRSVFELDFVGPMAVVVGSEGMGLRRLTAEKCDMLVHIPMNGALASLNVSHAAAVVMFELRRKSDISRTDEAGGI